MQNFFDQFDTAPAPKGPILGPAPVPKTPDPYQVQKDLRTEGRAEEDQEMQRQKFGVEVGNTGFTQRDKLRSDYNALPAVKEYRVAVQALAAALKRGEDGSGDTALIYDYVKALDPTSVVREAEVGMAASGASTLDAAAAKLKKELGIEGGGNLSPGVRKRLRREIINSVIPRVKQYNQFRNQFEELARRNQFDPYEIVGKHDADPYVELFREYDKRNKIGDYADTAARKGIGQSRPQPDEIVFGMDLPGSQTSEVTATRLNEQQQAALDAFLRANAGNPNFGPSQLSDFYRSMGIEGGAAAGDDAFFEAVRSGGAFGTRPNYESEDARRRAEMEALAKERYGDDPTTRASLLLKGGTLNLSDELAGVGGAIFDTLTGGSPAEGYMRERDLERFVQGESRDKYGVGYEIAGGLATPLGALKRPGTVGEFASQGAKLGAVAGFGEGEGLSGSAVNAVGGAGLGYVAGGAIGKAANVRAARAATKAARQSERAALRQDFAQEGVRALPANVGGSAVNRVTSGMAQSPIASDTIRDAAQDQASGFAEALKRRAGDVGTVRAIDDAGEAFRQAGKRGIARDAARIGRVYEEAGKQAAGVRITPTQGIRQIDDEIARLSEAKDIQQPLISELEKLKKSLTQNPDMSVEGLKLARSFAGKAASTEALRNTDAKATMKRIFGAIADDFDGGLRAAGKDKAARLFRKADALWSARIDDIDGAWEPVIGKNKSGEAIVETIESMARGKSGGFARLKTVMSGMTPDERADMTATIIDRMGRATPGRQGAAGDAYSADTFLTNWNKMSDKSKELLFSSPTARESMDRLARIAESIKESGRYANASNTSGGVVAQILAGGLGFAVGDVTGLAVPAASTYLTGRLMASPRFVNWLARAPKNMTPDAAKTYTGKLRGIAAAEPAIAGDITRFSQFLNAANDASPARAVAQGQEEKN